METHLVVEYEGGVVSRSFQRRIRNRAQACQGVRCTGTARLGYDGIIVRLAV